MIKVILFDADGVLINGKKFSETLEKDLGVRKEKTLLFFSGRFTECLIGKADLKKELEPHLKEWGWSKSINEFLEYWFKSEHEIDEDLIEYVSKLRKKGILCYVATNQEKYRTEYILNKMKFSNAFDNIFASAHLGVMKPQLEFFQSIYSQLVDVHKDEILFWDDTQGHVEAARKFGIHAELYTDINGFKQKMGDYIDQ